MLRTGLALFCFSLVLVSTVLVAPIGQATEKSASNPIQTTALVDMKGDETTLAQFAGKKAVAVIFSGTECPVNNLYTRRLEELHEEFSPKGVQFLLVNSNSQDPLDRVAEYAEEYKIPFPVLKDKDNKFADLVGATRTPEAVVLNSQGQVCYIGRIDDQFGIGFYRPKATKLDLANALNEVLAGKQVSIARTEVEGCYIGKIKKAVSDSNITYSKQISRIMQAHCLECHRDGQIAPFSLVGFDKAHGWADSIAEQVKDGRMPPWHADPKYGRFANDRSMPEEDKQTLLKWIEMGCPEGDPSDMPAPRTYQATNGWMIGTPDVVFEMPREVTIPAKTPIGGVPYMYFMVQTDFEEDMWVQAAEARPSNRAVVHHIIVFTAKPDNLRGGRGRDGLGDNFLVATAPGDLPLVLSPGIAKKVSKGDMLVFQMHYTPTGVQEVDRSSVGLIFSKKPPKHVARTRAITQNRFAIPPGASNHEVSKTTTFQKDAYLLSLMPHMHLRGKSFEYKLVTPDGKEEIILSVPEYDFNWQTSYRLAAPLFVPAGSRIICTGHFDNSVENPNNPDPTRTVYWGEQTWEEMLIGFVDYYYADERPGDVVASPVVERRRPRRQLRIPESPLLNRLGRIFTNIGKEESKSDDDSKNPGR